MNLLLVEDHQVRDGCRVLVSGRQLQHLHAILNCSDEDRLRVGRINGNMGHGRILSIRADSAELEVEFREAPPPPLPVTLVLALPRPKMLKRIMQTIAAMGVKQLHLINSYRVEKSFWQSPWLQPDAIREQLILGLEQCRDTVLPEVHLEQRFKPFVEDRLPRLVESGTTLVAHPYCHTPCPVSPTSPVTLAVGPEGGFIDYELEKLRDCGFQQVTLGPRILRVETAVPVLLSRLQP